MIWFNKVDTIKTKKQTREETDMDRLKPSSPELDIIVADHHGNKILNVLASFFIMLCIGGLYAWSIVATELIDNYSFTVSQTQLIFGTIVAIFPITMIFVGRFLALLRFRYLGYICGALYFFGYFVAAKSQGFLSMSYWE